MLGSFGPQEKPYEVVFPRQGWETAPDGMLARGSYTAKSQFIDDDKQCHLEYEYAFGKCCFQLCFAYSYIAASHPQDLGGQGINNTPHHHLFLCSTFCFEHNCTRL